MARRRTNTLVLGAKELNNYVNIQNKEGGDVSMTSQQIQYYTLLETERANRAKEDLSRREQDLSYSMKDRELAEKQRSNRAQERRTTRQINETTRSNKAREAENYRSNRAKEDENLRSNLAREGENYRSNRAKEVETHLNNARVNEIRDYEAQTGRLKAETEAKYAPFKNWQTSAAYFGEGVATHFVEPAIKWIGDIFTPKPESPEAKAKREHNQEQNRKYILQMTGGGLNPTYPQVFNPQIKY